MGRIRWGTGYMRQEADRDFRKREAGKQREAMRDAQLLGGGMTLLQLAAQTGLDIGGAYAKDQTDTAKAQRALLGAQTGGAVGRETRAGELHPGALQAQADDETLRGLGIRAGEDAERDRHLKNLAQLEQFQIPGVSEPVPPTVETQPIQGPPEPAVRGGMSVVPTPQGAMPVQLPESGGLPMGTQEVTTDPGRPGFTAEQQRAALAQSMGGSARRGQYRKEAAEHQDMARVQAEIGAAASKRGKRGRFPPLTAASQMPDIEGPTAPGDFLAPNARGGGRSGGARRPSSELDSKLMKYILPTATQSATGLKKYKPADLLAQLSEKERADYIGVLESGKMSARDFTNRLVASYTGAQPGVYHRKRDPRDVAQHGRKGDLQQRGFDFQKTQQQRGFDHGAAMQEDRQEHDTAKQERARVLKQGITEFLESGRMSRHAASLVNSTLSQEDKQEFDLEMAKFKHTGQMSLKLEGFYQSMVLQEDRQEHKGELQQKGFDFQKAHQQRGFDQKKAMAEFRLTGQVSRDLANHLNQVAMAAIRANDKERMKRLSAQLVWMSKTADHQNKIGLLKFKAEIDQRMVSMTKSNFAKTKTVRRKRLEGGMPEAPPSAHRVSAEDKYAALPEPIKDQYDARAGKEPDFDLLNSLYGTHVLGK